MTQDLSEPASGRPQRQKHPFLLLDVLVPSLQIGAGAGAAGLLYGAALGIVRARTPGILSIVSGIQFFALGSSYYASRRTVISTWGGDDKLSRSDKVKVSAIAGGLAGLTGGLVRGYKKIVPGVILFSILGAGGQAVFNSTVGNRDPSKPRTSWLESKWSPLTPLTDQQYKEMLEQKILKLDAETAIIDESIAATRASEKQRDSNNGTPSKKGS